MIGSERRQGIARHVRINRLFGILHDNQAATVLDVSQTGDTIVQLAGEQNAHYARAVHLRSRTEQRVDRRPVPVLFGAMDQADDVRTKH